MFKEISLILITAAIANMTPVLIKRLEIFNYAISNKYLGINKTYRGFIFGILAGTLTGIILGLGWKVSFIIGFSVLFGDLIGSFIKRRLNLKPGESCFPLDQLDSVILLVFFLKFSFVYSLWLILIWFLGHIVIRHIAFYLGINKEKW